ncbi:hypothetical protein Tco_1148870 [Tanacetum coccineum]
MAREAWGLSMDSSDYAHHRRQRVISKLLASDHKRQVQLTKTLKLLKGLQTQMVEFQRQHGPAKGPAQPDAPGDAGSSSYIWLCCSYAMQPVKYYGLFPASRLYRSFVLFSYPV